MKTAMIALTLLAGLLLCLSVVHAQGLTVANGKLLRDGAPYRGIGVNQCDLFQELIADGNNARPLNALRYLGETKIPFLRFWACGFWPSDWDLYFRDKEEWFRRLDKVVHTAEEAHVGLIPDLFWNIGTFPQLVGEFQDQWGNPDSKTIAFMRTYTAEVVTRYKDSPAIWGWEFANEFNLGCDLPNGMEFLGQVIPHLKVNLAKDPRNLLTHRMANVAYVEFAREVRRHDTRRFVTTGNSIPRGCAFHIGNKLDPIWGDDDAQQAFGAFQWYAPDPTDVVSVHIYGNTPEKMKYAGDQGIAANVALAKSFAGRLNKPLFVGEFAGTADEKQKAHFAEWQKQLLDNILEQKVDLAAFWVYEYTSDRSGVGLVRRDNEYAWVLDQIVDYNQKVQQQLAAEAR